MEELIKTFHVDWKLIIAQAVNFAIVLFLLKKFAYKPLVAMLEKRSTEIAKGLDNSKKAQKQLEESEKIKEQAILEAKKKSREIILETQNHTKEIEKEMLEKAQGEADRIINEARTRTEIERAEMMREVRSQAVELVSLAVGKIVEGKGMESRDKDSIIKALEAVK